MDKKKFNISNYFNGKLFFEAFKQIRIVGLIFFVCLNALAIFVPILLKEDIFDYYGNIPHQELFDIDSSMFPLVSLIYIAAPIMFIILFKFLTKRNGSDFYHSLPVKRSCLFITYVSAILSWLLIIAVTYTSILVISANICSSYFVIDYSVIIAYLVNITVSSLIIIGVFSIGTALTGTLTSNIVFSFGLLIIPRLVIVAFYDLVTSYAYTLTYNSGLLIFNPKCNLPFALIADTFSYLGGSESILGSINTSTLYTFVLAIIYTFIGLLLFVSRPSEVSGKNFRNRKIFSALKYGTGLLISLIIVVDSYCNIYEKDYKFLDEHFLEYILVIVGVALSMFAMEAATSKSIKKGLKTILATPFILLLDAVIIFSAISVTKYYNNEELNPESIDYVRVAFSDGRYIYDSYDYYYSMYYDDNLSNTYKIKKVKITDKEIIDMLINAYNSDRAERQHNSYKSEYWEVSVAFDAAIGEKNRCVYLTEAEYNALGEKLFKNSEIQKCMYSFPDKDSSAMRCDSLTLEQTHTLYDMLISEFKSLPTDKLYPDLFDLFNYNSDLGSVSNIYITCYENGISKSYDLPISTLTPKTFAQYMIYTNENSKDTLLSILDMLKGDYKTVSLYLSGCINNILADGTTSESYYYDIQEKFLKLDDSLNIIKDSLMGYYNANKPFNYDDIVSNGYYVARFTLAYNENSNFYTFGFYPDSDKSYGISYDGTTYGDFFILLPKDSPLLEGLTNYYDEENYYDEDIYYHEYYYN